MATTHLLSLNNPWRLFSPSKIQQQFHRQKLRILNSSSFGSYSSRPQETECPVPVDQQPVNEYQSLSSSTPFSWASDQLSDYSFRLFFTGASFALFVGLPVSWYGSVGIDWDPGERVLVSGLSGVFAVTVAVVRMYLGWAYVGNRLLSATVEYEETGWYDGQIWVKTPEILARDRLLGSFSNRACDVFRVIMGPDSSSLWQSFENPRDTLLPTQTMFINGLLNSRISDTNFSRGRFRFRLLEDGNAVLNPIDVHSELEYDTYYETGTNDNSNFSNSGQRVVLEETGHLFVVKRSGERLDLTAPLATRTGDYHYRATLNSDGVFVIYSYPKGEGIEQNWTAIWAKPDNICSDIFDEIGRGACGYNSICELDLNKRPNCKCPTGYSFLDPNDEYSSCTPDFVESCDEKGMGVGDDLYEIVDLGNTNWPMNDYEKMLSSEEDCRSLGRTGLVMFLESLNAH